jgi:hypothetical protein
MHIKKKRKKHPLANRTCVVDLSAMEGMETTKVVPRADAIVRSFSAVHPDVDITSLRKVKKLPSLPVRGKNLAIATKNHVAAGRPKASQEDIDARLAICLGCPSFVPSEGKGGKAGSCAECGCPVRSAAGHYHKLAWAEQKCPIGKWGPVDG